MDTIEDLNRQGLALVDEENRLRRRLDEIAEQSKLIETALIINEMLRNRNSRTVRVMVVSPIVDMLVLDPADDDTPIDTWMARDAFCDITGIGVRDLTTDATITITRDRLDAWLAHR